MLLVQHLLVQDMAPAHVSADKATVPLGLDMFVAQTAARWNLLAAASLISAAPSLLLVMVLQRSFVRGIVIAGFGGR